MAEESTPKKKRGPRRNFAKIVNDLEMYCDISIAVLEPLTDSSDHNKGQVAALKAVQSRLRGNNG